MAPKKVTPKNFMPYYTIPKILSMSIHFGKTVVGPTFSYDSGTGEVTIQRYADA